MADTRRLALLIDGDNAQASLLEQMIAEVNKYGVVTIRRVYGDWTEPQMKSWKEALHVSALQPFQQFRYTTGKNATDSAMIIDAMDILYTAGVDGFCIVSSDSDYTRLATRIREKNLFVMGIGKATTPRAFVNACDVFVYTENLTTEQPLPKSAPAGGKQSKPANATAPEQDALLSVEIAVPDGLRPGSAGQRLGATEHGRHQAAPTGPGVRPAHVWLPHPVPAGQRARGDLRGAAQEGQRPADNLRAPERRGRSEYDQEEVGPSSDRDGSLWAEQRFRRELYALATRSPATR